MQNDKKLIETKWTKNIVGIVREEDKVFESNF